MTNKQRTTNHARHVRAPLKLIYALYALSGFVSLGYQVSWFRICANQLGSNNLTFILVICCFIGGLGTGSLCSRRISSTCASLLPINNPLRVYGIVECLVSATMLLTVGWVVFSPSFAGAFPYALHDGIYFQTLPYQLGQVAQVVVCVFVPCFFMGVTFPLLCAVFVQHERFPSALYAWNTCGACVGVLASEFILLRWMGHIYQLYVLIVVNLALGLFFIFSHRPAALFESGRALHNSENWPAGHPNRRRRLELTAVGTCLILAILSGFLSGALEADMFKRIQLTGMRTAMAMSFVSFWAILAIFLGSWTIESIQRMKLNWIKLAYVLAVTIYIAIGLNVFPIRELIFRNLFPMLQSMLSTTADNSLKICLWIFCGIVVFPAFYLISLMLPYVCNQLQAQRRHLALYYGANTVGFCCGMMLFTWIAPRVNVFYSLKFLWWTFAVVAAGVLLLNCRPKFDWAVPAGMIMALVAAACLVPTDFDSSLVSPDPAMQKYPIRGMRSNAAHTIYVLEKPTGDQLYFDSHSMSGVSAADSRYMRLMAHFPLLAHPDPKHALLICFGVGNTASAIVAHESIERLDIVELNHQVFRIAPEFSKTNRRVYESPKVRLIHDDGRNYLRRTDQQYDLITSEPPPPTYAGVYRLYSVEYYRDVSAHLTSGGMMTQWLPTSELSKETLAMVVNTFTDAFEHCAIFVGSGAELILIGSQSPFNFQNIEARFAAARAVTEDLRAIGIDTPVNLLARPIAMTPSLRQTYAHAAVISDYRNDMDHYIVGSGISFVALDYPAVIQFLRNSQLASGTILREIYANAAQLCTAVPDFPIGSLLHIKGSQYVKYADAPWHKVRALNNEAVALRNAGHIPQAIQRLEQSLAIVPEQPLVLEIQKQLQAETRR
jgi:spermidine synthase